MEGAEGLIILTFFDQLDIVLDNVNDIDRVFNLFNKKVIESH